MGFDRLSSKSRTYLEHVGDMLMLLDRLVAWTRGVDISVLVSGSRCLDTLKNNHQALVAAHGYQASMPVGVPTDSFLGRGGRGQAPFHLPQALDQFRFDLRHIAARKPLEGPHNRVKLASFV